MFLRERARDEPMSTSAELTLGGLAAAARDAEAPDEQLARRGDAESFAVLYQRHLPAVFRFVSGRLPSSEEAEDVTSEIFRQAWAGRRGFHGNGSFRAWMFTIVRRTVANHYRHVHPVARLDPAVAEAVVDEVQSPESHVEQDERELQVRRLLGELSPQQQEILLLRFAAG